MYNMGLEIGDFVGVSQPLTSMILNGVEDRMNKLNWSSKNYPKSVRK